MSQIEKVINNHNYKVDLQKSQCYRSVRRTMNSSVNGSVATAYTQGKILMVNVYLIIFTKINSGQLKDKCEKQNYIFYKIVKNIFRLWVGNDAPPHKSTFH
jgi:hypothetical protein